MTDARDRQYEGLSRGPEKARDRGGAAPVQQRTEGSRPPRVDAMAGRRRTLLVSAGVLFAAALLIVLFNIDWNPAPDASVSGPSQIERIDPPPHTTSSSSSGSAPADATTPRDVDIALRSGANAKMLDESGRVVQEYVARRVEPIGRGRVRLEQPRAWIYFDNEDVMLLEGDMATASRRSDGLLESGTITGNVVVRLFSKPDVGSVNTDTDSPRLVIHTDHADLDHLRGEVLCPDWVDVQTPELHFRGVGLAALYSDADGLQRLVIDRSTAPIRIARSAYTAAPAPIDASGDSGTPGERERESSGSVPIEPLATPEAWPATGSAPPRRAGSAAGGEGRDRLIMQDRPRSNGQPPREGGRAGQDAGPAAQDTETQQRADRDNQDDWLEERRRAARERRAEASPESNRPKFYRAIFAEDVRIWREGTSEVITGDELHLIFSMSNEELRDRRADRGSATPQMIAAPGTRRLLASHPTLSTRDFLLAVRLGAMSHRQDPAAPGEPQIMHRIVPEVAQGDVYIDYAGRLVVSPLLDDSDHLATTDDVAVRVYGSPVTIDDPSRDLHATCSTVEYVTGEERLALLGSPRFPLDLRTEEIAAAGERFDYDLNEERGRFVGSGNMHVHRPVDEVELLQDPPPADPQGADSRARIGSTFEITWSSGVELLFERDPVDGAAAPAAEDSRRKLEEAIFTGDVVVTEERFNLLSDRLQVLFNSESTRRDTLKRLIADGNVVARDLGARSGYMEGQHLRVEFEPNAEGESLPREMYARGNALVRDPEQSMRANELNVFLVEAIPVDREGEPDAPQPERAEGSFDRMQIERFLALEDVEIVLSSGVRATGDRLEGNAIEGIADLTGREVVVTGSPEDIQFDSVGTHARVDKHEDGRPRVTLHGGGKANINNAPRQSAPAPPAVDPPVEMPAEEIDDEAAAEPEPDPTNIDITWTEAFIYTEGREQGSGTIEMRGNVVSRSVSAREENVLRSLRQVYDFGEESGATLVDSEGVVHQETRRVLRNMIARGEARLESRTWETADRTRSPRLIHLTGPHIEYNQQLMEARVYGEGEMLVHDPRPPAEGEARRAELTGRGSTYFTWKRDMEMKQFVDERYDVRMRGGVEMRHLSARGEQHNAYLTGEDVQVALTRRDSDERQGGLDFGGRTEVQRIEARGDAGNPLINLNAQQKRIVAHELVYATTGNIARIVGTDRVPAEIRTERQIVPMRAIRFVWDLTSDSVRVDSLR